MMIKANPVAGIAAPKIEGIEREAWLDMFAAAPDVYVAASGLRFERLGAAAALAHRTIPITEFNRVFAAGLVAPWSRPEFRAAAEWLQDHAAPGWAIQMSPATRPVAAAEWAKEHALATAGTGWAKWYQPASKTVHWAKTSLEIRRVDRGLAFEFADVVQQGFGLPETTTQWFSKLPGRDGWSTYLAYEGLRPVAAAAMFMRHGWAWLGIDATLAEARGRGAQSGLIARRLNDGFAAGAMGFTAETGNPAPGETAGHASFRNYERSGFSLAYVRPNYKVQPVK